MAYRSWGLQEPSIWQGSVWGPHLWSRHRRLADGTSQSHWSSPSCSLQPDSFSLPGPFWRKATRQGDRCGCEQRLMKNGYRRDTQASCSTCKNGNNKRTDRDERTDVLIMTWCWMWSGLTRSVTGWAATSCLLWSVPAGQTVHCNELSVTTSCPTAATASTDAALNALPSSHQTPSSPKTQLKSTTCCLCDYLFRLTYSADV